MKGQGQMGPGFKLTTLGSQASLTKKISNVGLFGLKSAKRHQFFGVFWHLPHENG